MIVHTAAGGHTIPLLGRAEADELRDRIAGLARAEEDEPEPEPETRRSKRMAERRRLHPAAIARLLGDALRGVAFPLRDRRSGCR